MVPKPTPKRLRLATPSMRVLAGKGLFKLLKTFRERVQRLAQLQPWRGPPGLLRGTPSRHTPLPLTATNRCRKGGTSKIAAIGTPAEKRAIEIAQIGKPTEKFVVPSRGSTTQ